MKKLILGLSVLIASLTFFACSDDDDDDKRIEYSAVPVEARTFITDHFTGFDESQVAYVEQDKDGTYEVVFANRVEIDFYSNGVWKEIDMNGNPLPESIAMLVPTNALSYVSTQYPGVAIEEIEKNGPYSEAQSFKIELRGDIDIYFDYLGNVISNNGNPNGGNQTITADKLPKISQDFLTKYFGIQNPIIEKEWDKYEATYNKDAANEVEVEFHFSTNAAIEGTFKSIEVDGADDIIRTVITDISPSILTYIQANYAGYKIEQFAKTPAYFGNGYKVEIEQGKTEYDLYFDNDGKFIKAVHD